MQFNPTTEYNSIVKNIDDLVDTNVNKYPLTKKARACNTALDKAYTILFSSTDSKNYDDPNFTTIPQGTYDITAGERNITIFKDSEGAEILKIHKVIAKNESGNWYELKGYDIRDKEARDIAYGDDTGQISSYDWVGTSIVFDVVPETTIAGGLKVFYARNSSYFDENDTTKEPGLPVVFHDYIVYYASWQYAMSKGLERKNDLYNQVLKLEKELADFASAQDISENKRLTPFRVNAE